VTLRVLIVDDEPLAQDRLRELLALQADVDCVGAAGSGTAALAQIDALRPDVVFLDIDIPEMDGLSVAAALPDDGPRVIFATAFDDHAVRAFELAAVDYLLKPIREQRLRVALDRARERTRSAASGARAVIAAMSERVAPKRMAVRSGARYVVFDTDSISAVIVQDHYSTLHVNDGRELLSEEPLDHLVTRLGPAFMRVHRSAAVNIQHIQELVREGDRQFTAVVATPVGLRVPISRDRLDELKGRLGIV
jgi:two-component system LytT family response regulator